MALIVISVLVGAFTGTMPKVSDASINSAKSAADLALSLIGQMTLWLGLFGVGFVAAFISAFVCVRWLLRYISSHDFTAFAWYRIAFGLVILLFGYGGGLDWQ